MLTPAKNFFFNR